MVEIFGAMSTRPMGDFAPNFDKKNKIEGQPKFIIKLIKNKAKLFGYLFIAFLTLKTIWLQSYNKVSKNLSKSGAKSPQFTVHKVMGKVTS